MNKGYYKILNNDPISANGNTGAMSVWKMTLEGNTSSITAPGQFVNIAVPGRYLRRPISICDWTPGTITIVYRIVGGGTMDLSTLQPGASIEMLTGLGNGFSLYTSGQCPTSRILPASPLLIGGGVGLPPMLGLAKRFLEKGTRPTVVAGFASASDAILAEDFAALGLDLHIATMDGSLGTPGTVLDAISTLSPSTAAGAGRGPENASLRSAPPFATLTVPPLTMPRVARFSDPLPAPAPDKFYACGPKPMLKALCENLTLDGELSVEERMGCGFGICMGCSCKTAGGMKRVCKEGPVFKKEDLIW